MKQIITIFLLCTAPIYAGIQYSYQELLYVPWGNEMEQAGLRTGPEGQYGPRSFAIQNDTVYLLDTENRAIKSFVNNTFSRSISLRTPIADDLAWQSEQLFFILQGNRIEKYESGMREAVFAPVGAKDIITGIGIFDHEISAIINGSISAAPVQGRLTKSAAGQAIQTTSGNQISVNRTSPGQFEISRDNESIITIQSGTDPVALVRYIGGSPEGALYLYTEYIETEVPLQVLSFIEVYSNDGDLQTRIALPQIRHSAIFREFYVDMAGNIYHMISAPEGIYIIKWALETQDNTSASLLTYPEKFSQVHHYNMLNPVLPKMQDSQISVEPDMILATVTRAEALAIGDTYVQHQWTAEQKNLTYGRITDRDGIEIQTPSWVQVGLNTKIPYQWGGFWTIAGFDQAMRDGKYAGDIATSGVSGHCAGVDCSGFVSRCWKLDTHYSTRMMDDYITIAYDSWSLLQPGDAVHIPGHVRMFIDFNNDGSLLVVESSGRDWRVAYHSYTYAELTSYTPRYYIKMQGSPNMLARPVTQGITISDSIDISWTLSAEQATGGYKVYTSPDGKSWEYAPTEIPLPEDTRSIKLACIEGLPQFFKLAALSAENPETESYPSDVYGYLYNPGMPRILIVDGFDRTDGSYQASSHDFAMRAGLSLAKNPVSFETCDNDAVISGQFTLSDYDAVFWLLGDESVGSESFNSIEQQLVKDFLKAGGNLFVTGSEIGWDLGSKGSAEDLAFFSDYLCARFQQDDSRSYQVNGASGSVFADLTVNFDDGTHGVYEEDYPDAFLAHNGSQALLNYGNGLVAATGVQKVFPGGSKAGAVLLMGFPLETIYTGTERDELVNRVLQYFGLIETSGIIARNDIPFEFTLDANYPNPFNPTTSFRFTLPAPGTVNLVIFNMLGQHVDNVIDGPLPAGTHSVQYNAAHLASGTYIYQLRWNKLELNRRMMLVK